MSTQSADQPPRRNGKAKKGAGKPATVRTMLRKVAAGSLAVLVLSVASSLAACSSTPPADTATNATEGGLPLGVKPKPVAKATDIEVSFDSGGTKIAGSLRRPPSGGTVPAAVLIAGSGPTDRDGNNKLSPGNVGTLSWLADQLAADGVASLRYDKLGTGKTGLGAFESHPQDVGFDVFVQEARDALSFVAAQPEIDTTHLMLVGHSEGGLIALAVSTDPGGAPGATALALVCPLPMRYLDLLAQQIQPKVDAATMASARSAIDAIRAGRPVPSLPPALQSLFGSQNVTFLHQADQIDPLQLASHVDPSVKALVACADKDIQVPCPAVQALASAFPPGVATFVTFSATDHVLKEVDKSDGSEYTQPLPYSSSAKDALAQLVQRWKV